MTMGLSKPSLVYPPMSLVPNMRNLQQTPSIYEYLVTNGWSPDAISQWVARPRAVLQLEQAQAGKKQEALGEEQPGAGKGRLEAGGSLEGAGETLPIEGGPRGPSPDQATPTTGSLPAVNRWVDMSTEELGALGVVRTADNQYYRINQLPGGRVIMDPDGRHAQVLYVRMMGKGANSEDNGVSLY